MKNCKLLAHNNEWDFDTIHNAWDVIQEIAHRKYALDWYPARFELIDFEGMLNAYSTYALPGLYSHWSFGKKYAEEYNRYKDTANLAFEVVINSNPSVCYLMDSNTATTQILVMAHAAIGHSSFFKGNHMFKTHTNADTIIPFLARSSARIKELEAEHGVQAVETELNYIHKLQNFSFDKHKKTVLSSSQRKLLEAELNKARDSSIDKVLNFSSQDILDRLVPPAKKIDPLVALLLGNSREQDEDVPLEENILKFIYENGINTRPLARELIGIFLKINQYLYPQMHTQLMNEGWASFWHYTLMHDLYEEGYIDEASYWEFIQLHCSVLRQTSIKQNNFSINPYKLGFDIYQDIKRISITPTSEDKEWFPDWAGNNDWLGNIKYAMKTYKDESFISQYLSPKVIRDNKFLILNTDYRNRTISVTGDHTQQYYVDIINNLSKHYDLFSKIPTVGVTVHPEYKEKLLVYLDTPNSDRVIPLSSKSALKVYLKYLWNGDVIINEDLGIW